MHDLQLQYNLRLHVTTMQPNRITNHMLVDTTIYMVVVMLHHILSHAIYCCMTIWTWSSAILAQH